MSERAQAIPGMTLVVALLATALAAVLVLRIRRPVVLDQVGEPAPDRWPDMRLNLNEATAAELSLLPGIGPVLAERIVADRTRHGPFRSLQDLERVDRVGPVITADAEPYVVVEPVPSAENGVAGPAAPHGRD